MNGNVWVVAPFVLAVIGTVVMLFTNSANALKIALIFALWAAVAGIMVVDRTRRDRDRALADVSKREAELADARRELADATHAAPAAAAAPAPSIDTQLLRELQEEIQALRSQLEEMRGAVFEYEPAAVQASARRIQEIERPQPAPKPEPAPKPAPEPSRPGPSSDDTAKIAAVTAPGPSRRRPAGAPTADAVAGRLGQQPTRQQPNPLSEIISERAKQERTATDAPAPKPQPTPPPAPKVQPKPEPTPAPKPAPKPEPAPAPTGPTRGGRRRRDERGEDAVSVADLLARQQQERN